MIDIMRKHKMRLYRLGYIVATVENYRNFAYCAWPLSNIKNDKIADELSTEADDRWFTVYDMQEIIPDIEYIKRYYQYCKQIGLDAIILLVESTEKIWDINDNIVIEEILGYDCIGTVYYSYLKNDYEDFKNQLRVNSYGLLCTYDDVEKFIKLRKKAIYDGINLENFWEETPIRLSKISV